MDIKKVLSESVEKRFQAEATINSLRKKICGIAEYETLKKYKSVNLLLKGMEFELIGVKASFDFYDIDIPKKVNIQLAYLFISKRKRVKEIKDFYANNNRFPFTNSKNPFFEERLYSVDLDKVLNKEINLKIDGSKKSHEEKLAKDKKIFEEKIAKEEKLSKEKREKDLQQKKSFDSLAKTINNYKNNA